MADENDSVIHDAETAIAERQRRFERLTEETRAIATTREAAADLTRLRFELTAIRRLLEKLAAK